MQIFCTRLACQQPHYQHHDYQWKKSASARYRMTMSLFKSHNVAKEREQPLAALASEPESHSLISNPEGSILPDLHPLIISGAKG